jgi:hypothetical protein
MLELVTPNTILQEQREALPLQISGTAAASSRWMQIQVNSGVSLSLAPMTATGLVISISMCQDLQPFSRMAEFVRLLSAAKAALSSFSIQIP